MYEAKMKITLKINN